MKKHHRWVDWTGHVTGKLTVLREHPVRSRKRIRWVCRCECGREVIVFAISLARAKRPMECGFCGVHGRVPTPEEAAYAAGFFDGEGAVMIWYPRDHKDGVSRHRMHVTLSQTDERPIRWLQERWGGNVLYRPSVPSAGVNAKGVWQIALSCVRAAKFLRDIRPYVVLKGERIDIALEFQQTMLAVRERGTAILKITPELFARRAELRTRLMAMNKRGAA